MGIRKRSAKFCVPNVPSLTRLSSFRFVHHSCYFRYRFANTFFFLLPKDAFDDFLYFIHSKHSFIVKSLFQAAILFVPSASLLGPIAAAAPRSVAIGRSLGRYAVTTAAKLHWKLQVLNIFQASFPSINFTCDLYCEWYAAFMAASLPPLGPAEETTPGVGLEYGADPPC